MNIRELAKNDIENITSNLNEFGLAITFEAPNGDIADVVGIESKVYMAFDMDTGKDINVQKAHVTIAEKFFIENDYPVRNASGRVSMKKHKVTYVDVNGITCNFEVIENFPDETLGLIVFSLGERKV